MSYDDKNHLHELMMEWWSQFVWQYVTLLLNTDIFLFVENIYNFNIFQDGDKQLNTNWYIIG
jgi:hypothetical protein